MKIWFVLFVLSVIGVATTFALPLVAQEPFVNSLSDLEQSVYVAAAAGQQPLIRNRRQQFSSVNVDVNTGKR